MRLRTLVLIRWAAVAGQLFTAAVVHWGLGFSLPVLAVCGAIALSALLNLTVSLGRPASARIDDREATIFLAFDILQLAVLLYLTGGLINPFSLLLLAPVAIGATILSLASNIALSLLTIVSIGLLGLFHQPLPWRGPPPELPEIYQAGAWAGLTLTTLLVTLYGWRLAEEARQMDGRAAAAQAALAREQRMSALGALAAAAAHELGSPLSTIAVVAKEMLREVETDDPLREDVELLSAESDRCRAILARLSVDPAGDVSDAYTLVPLPALIEAAAQNYERDGIAITFEVRAGRRGRADDGADPGAQPGDHAGHRQHRAERRVVRPPRGRDQPRAGRRNGRRSRSRTTGPASREALLDELGTPFISTRQGEEGHMGLGVFIAKTLLERTGATVTFGNRARERPAARRCPCAGQTRSSRLHSGRCRRSSHEPGHRRQPPRVARPSPARRANKDRTLLIADDDAAFRNRIARALELRGFIVTAVGSVAEALAQTARPPAFAVLDLRLGDGNGLELVGPLRQARPDIRIVVLTGYGNIATAVAAVKEGAVDYLAKPADADAIEQALTAHGRKLPPPPSNPMSADRVRWEHIQRVFEQCDRNVSETARRLNMHRRTLQRILGKHAPREH